MSLLVFLLIFPAAAACVLLALKNDRARSAVVKVSSLVIAVASLVLFVTTFHRYIEYFKADYPAADRVMLLGEALMAAYIFFTGLKHRKYFVSALVAVQSAIQAVLEIYWKRDIIITNNLLIDKFSIIMALIIGIIGSLICLYSVGYMRDFHADYRKEVKDRRNVFFFVIFLFLSAMFGIVFSNNLLWLYFFWEVTTLCSFLLIGYKRTHEARENAFRALFFNLIGGLALVAGIAYLTRTAGIIEVDKIILVGKSGVLLPAVLFSFAGMVKSAQLPFSSWLLGAMVAPTPVSALLHSSTMVKAGVYLILRFSTVLQGTAAGFFVALVGAVTFVVASFIAVTQSDAKKVLAYSTVANLGLIVLCAGIGTYEAMWAAIMLILFHAVAKCLLFLCVGTVEHKIHSRDIEDMHGLIISMPKLSIMMQIGMAGMFLAPFGMLISKWAVLKALVDFNPLFAVFIVFGSAATLFFWVKWMGRLITVVGEHEDLEEGISKTEWAPIFLLSLMTIALCGFFPVVSSVLIQPYVMEIYGKTFSMSHGNVVIMSIMLAMVMLFPLSFFNYGKRVKVIDAYLGGANAPTSLHTLFVDSRGLVREMEMKNYYLERYFGEKKLYKVGAIICLVLIVAMLGVAAA
jgi:ech hydrogenase subunit A